MSNKKPSWEKRYQIIKDSHPSVQSEWGGLIDDDMFIKILGDVLKSERRTSTPGKRPGLSKNEGMEKINKLLDRDFSDLEFSKAFRTLSSGRSIRSITSVTGLSKSHIQRLLSGEDNPSIDSIEKIAKGFKKHPSYFLEYRIYKVLGMLNSVMADNPETATSWYLKMRQ